MSLIALMMEAARTSETSVDIQLRTRQYILEDSELQLIISSPWTLVLQSVCVYVYLLILQYDGRRSNQLRSVHGGRKATHRHLLPD
jgi:hypothetical protein